MSHEFDIFKFSDELGRQHALPYLVMHLLDNLPNKEENFGNFDENKLVLFLNQIQKGYRQKVQYHNDLHGADVAQFMFLLIKDANLDKIAELKHFDMVSMLISSVCHDFDHDGFNNAYHVNKMSSRALRYHDESVQENYHAAESISIMLDPRYNFLENVNKDEVKMFRKRMVGMILSTDMAKHMQDLTQFKNRCETRGISAELDNGYMFLDRTDASTLFDSQQQLLEILEHACDVSPPTRDFDLVKKWTFLLFEEFFIQGDIEKSYNLPVSFLCDREKTQVSTNQPGFLNFIVLPLFKAITEVLPECDHFV